MKTKILIIVFLFLLGGVIYFAYPVFKSRYFQPSESDTDQESPSFSEEDDNLPNGDSPTTDEESEDIPDESPVADDVFIEIDAEDCEEGCEQFEDADDKKYCQQYCGTQSETTTSDDCENLEDLEKDYCFKNQALSKKNFNLCKKIVDKKIAEACKNQLTEEILNGSEIINNEE